MFIDFVLNNTGIDIEYVTTFLCYQSEYFLQTRLEI